MKKKSKMPKNVVIAAKDFEPMSTSLGSYDGSPATSTPGRRNSSGQIERTERFYNIDNGLVPFKYSHNLQNKSSLNVRDAVVLCQKAYYNFAAFRNVIELMVDFSCSKLYFTGGNKKAREFLTALYKKINFSNFQDQFFREYYRSGNVFIYRLDYDISPEDITQITQTFGAESVPVESDKVKLPSKYRILQPANIQYGGNIAFTGTNYYQVLSDYEFQRLRNPSTPEDYEVLKSLSPENQKKIQSKTYSSAGAFVTIPLDTAKVSAVFFKKQDYEPFSVPMGFPVLEDINWKQEMKKMDMALTRTTQQSILLVTMGCELKSGALNINQNNIKAMQALFQNQSVGKVVVSDFTTKAEFIIPDIASILDPKKYEIVNDDIRAGLNDILVGDEKFSSTSIKVNIFIERLNQGRETFLNDFLAPEIKRLCKSLGFKNFPTPHFEEIDIKDNSVWMRVVTQLAQLGLLTPDETNVAIKTGRLPEPEDSLESQKAFKSLKDQGLYAPIAAAGAGAMSSGRPTGSGSPQTTKKVAPKGGGKSAPAIAGYSAKGIAGCYKEFEEITAEVEEALKKKHKKKTLNADQKIVAEDLSKSIIISEPRANWKQCISSYVSSPKETSPEVLEELEYLIEEHNVDLFTAAILKNSQLSEQLV